MRRSLDDDFPFHFVQTLLKRLDRLALFDLHLPYNNGLPTVDFAYDAVDHRARVFDLAFLKRLVRPLDGAGAVKGTWEGGVEVDDRDGLLDALLAVVGAVAVEDVEEGAAHDVHPAGEHDEVRPVLDDDFRDLEVIVLARCAGVRLEIGLEREIRGGDGRCGLLGADEPVRGLAVGDDADDACVGEGGGVLGVDEGLEVGTFQSGGLSGRALAGERGVLYLSPR